MSLETLLETLRAPLRKLYEAGCRLEKEGESDAALGVYQKMMAQTTEYKKILDLIAVRLQSTMNAAPSTSEDNQESDVYTDLLFNAFMLKYDVLNSVAEKAYMARYLSLFFLHEVGDGEIYFRLFQVAAKEEGDVLTSEDWQTFAEFYRHHVPEEDVWRKNLTVMQIFYRAAQAALSKGERDAVYNTMRVFFNETMRGSRFETDERLVTGAVQGVSLLQEDFSSFIESMAGDDEEIAPESALSWLKECLGEDRYWDLLLGYLHLISKQYSGAADHIAIYFSVLFEKGLPQCCREDAVRVAYQRSLKTYFSRLVSAVPEVEDPHHRVLYLMSLTEISLHETEFDDARSFVKQIEEIALSSAFTMSEEERCRYKELKSRLLGSEVDSFFSMLMKIQTTPQRAVADPVFGGTDAQFKALVDNVNALSTVEKNDLYQKIMTQTAPYPAALFVGLSRADWGILLCQSPTEINERLKEQDAQPDEYKSMMLAASVGNIEYALPFLQETSAGKWCVRKNNMLSPLEFAIRHNQVPFLRIMLLYVDRADQRVSAALGAAISVLEEKDLQLAGCLFHVLGEFSVDMGEAKKRDDIKSVSSPEILRALIGRGFDYRHSSCLKNLFQHRIALRLRAGQHDALSLVEELREWMFFVDLKTTAGKLLGDALLQVAAGIPPSSLMREKLSVARCLVEAGVVLSSEVNLGLLEAALDQVILREELDFLVENIKAQKGDKNSVIGVVMAMGFNDVALGEYFLSQGTDINKGFHSGTYRTNFNVLHVVLESMVQYHLRSFKNLFRFEISALSPREWGMFACDQIFSDLINWYELLLAYGAEPNAQDERGETVLHILLSIPLLSAQSKLALVELFIHYNASLGIKNKEQQLPLEKWLRCGLRDEVDLLDENGSERALLAVLLEYTPPAFQVRMMQVVLSNDKAPLSALRWCVEAQTLPVRRAHIDQVMQLRRGIPEDYLKALPRLRYLMPHYLRTMPASMHASEKERISEWIGKQFSLFFEMVKRPFFEANTKKMIKDVEGLLGAWKVADAVSGEIAVWCDHQRERLLKKQEDVRDQWARYFALPEEEVKQTVVMDAKSLFITEEARGEGEAMVLVRGCNWVKQQTRRLELKEHLERYIHLGWAECILPHYLQSINDPRFREEEASRVGALVTQEKVRLQEKEIKIKIKTKEERMAAVRKEMLAIFRGQSSQPTHFKWARTWLPLFLLDMSDNPSVRKEMQEKALFLLDFRERKLEDEASTKKAASCIEEFEASINKVKSPTTIRKMLLWGMKRHESAVVLAVPPPTASEAERGESAVASELPSRRSLSFK